MIFFLARKLGADKEEVATPRDRMAHPIDPASVNVLESHPLLLRVRQLGDPCWTSREWVNSLPRDCTPQYAWNRCQDATWLLWVIGRAVDMSCTGLPRMLRLAQALIRLYPLTPEAERDVEALACPAELKAVGDRASVRWNDGLGHVNWILWAASQVLSAEFPGENSSGRAGDLAEVLYGTVYDHPEETLAIIRAHYPQPPELPVMGEQ